MDQTDAREKHPSHIIVRDGTSITVEDVAYHRNGVSGIGFHVVTFRWAERHEEPRPMVGTVFPELGAVAVFDRELLRQGNIGFAEGNSWRGDHFEAALREAIAQYDRAVCERLGLPAPVEAQ